MRLTSIVVLLLLTCCNPEIVKDNTEVIYLSNQDVLTRYSGTFQRISPTSKMNPVNVTLDFEENRFSGKSAADFPTICSGLFEQVGSQVTFTNSCGSNEDPTLLLSGTFDIEFQNGLLVLTKSYPEHVFSIFVLKKN